MEGQEFLHCDTKEGHYSMHLLSWRKLVLACNGKCISTKEERCVLKRCGWFNGGVLDQWDQGQSQQKGCGEALH